MDKLQRMSKGKIPGPETGIEVRKSICTLCDPTTQCGLDCYVKDGRIIKVEGSLENPNSAGALCSKGAAQRQWVYHQERLLTPLKRVGPRGSGEMTPISWTEALDTIAENLLRLKAESGPESVIFLSGYPKQYRPFLQRLAFLYGSPHYCTESAVCSKATGIAWRLNYGQLGRPDMGKAECIVVWGRNPLYSNVPFTRSLLSARDRGAKLIVVDPQISPTAGIADLHLRLRPGTDGALALAMANVIISEGLYDREFVSQWTRGFEEYRAYAATFTLERAEEITGVPAALIHEAAVLYAVAKPAALMTSPMSVVHNTNGVQNQRAATALVGLTGNFDVPGGNVVQAASWLEINAGFATREREFAMPFEWSELPTRLGAERFPVWTEIIDEAQSMDIPRRIATGEPYPLRSLIGFGLNHRMWPDSQGFLKAMEKLDFIVDVDLFLTDTAKYADIVLPTCSSVERSELRCYPQQYVVYATPVIEPLGESRSDTDIIFALADKLGVDYNPASDAPEGVYLANGAPDFTAPFEAALDWILEPSGMKVAELKKHPGGMPAPNPSPLEYKKYEKKGFPTPSGKMEFVSSILEKHFGSLGADALPRYDEPKYSPPGAPELAAAYPYVLNSGSRLPMFIHSRTFRLPWTRSLRPEPMADINPVDAAELGVKQGDDIELSTPSGSIRVKANVTEMAREGTVHMFHDYPEANVNLLIEGDYLDPISGYPGFKGLLCAIKKVEADSGVNEPAPAAAEAEEVTP